MQDKLPKAQPMPELQATSNPRPMEPRLPNPLQLTPAQQEMLVQLKQRVTQLHPSTPGKSTPAQELLSPLTPTTRNNPQQSPVVLGHPQ